MQHLRTSFRIVFYTMLFCCILYTLIILTVGQTIVPGTAEGWLLRDAQGNIIGSATIAQSFTQPEYLWPRPSAADYNAAGAAGSNLSPANKKLADRAKEILEKYPEQKIPFPADLVTASGSGLDPHITISAALYQAERIATARGVPRESVINVFNRNSIRAMGFLAEPIVNVLLTNIELDRIGTESAAATEPQERRGGTFRE